MYTVIIFWQNDELNEEAEWVLDKKDTFVITLKQELNKDYDLKKMITDIAYAVNAREQWNLYLIDNYCYQCVFSPKGNNNIRCCCGNWSQCNKEACVKPKCGIGRNPFTDIKNIELINYRNHRRDLLEIVNAILVTKDTEFIHPQNTFVIAVRDGDFYCKQELKVPNRNLDYWRVSKEFPDFCRYLVYDMYYLRKRAFHREVFWLYCLIEILVSANLQMNQLQPRYMYRIDVQNSRYEYYRYLMEYQQHIVAQIEVLEESRMQYEKHWNTDKERICPYTFLIHGKKMTLHKLPKYILKRNEWLKFRRETERKIYQIFNEVPVDYVRQWDELRRQVDEESGESGEIYAEEKAKYENRILNITFHKDAESIKAEPEYISIENNKKEYEMACLEYDTYLNYNIQFINYIIYVGAVLLLWWGFCFLGDYKEVQKILQENFMCNSIGLALAFALSCLIYHISVWWKLQKIGKRINDCISRIEEYQATLNEDRINFLKSTRDIMLYWKREHNLNAHRKQKEINKRKIDEQIREMKKLKKKLDMLIGMEEDIRNTDKKGIKVTQRKYVLIDGQRVETKFPFFESIKFLMREETRGKNT